MTKYGFNDLGGEKLDIFSPTFSPTTHYTIHLPQIYPSPSKNPAPSSSRANLSSTKTPFSVFQKTGFTRIGYASQSSITTNSRTIFEEKSERVRAFGGEGKVLPRLMGRGFERDQTTLPIAREMGVEITLKVCSDEDLMGMGTSQGVEKRNVINEAVIRTYEVGQ